MSVLWLSHFAYWPWVGNTVSTCYTSSKPKYIFLYDLLVFKWGNWVGQCAYVCLGLETGAICLLWLITGQREHSTCRDLETSWSCFEFGAFCLIRNNCIAWGTLVMCFLLSYAAWDGFSFPTNPAVLNLWVETPLGSHSRLHYNS